MAITRLRHREMAAVPHWQTGRVHGENSGDFSGFLPFPGPPRAGIIANFPLNPPLPAPPAPARPSPSVARPPPSAPARPPACRLRCPSSVTPAPVVSPAAFLTSVRNARPRENADAIAAWRRLPLRSRRPAVRAAKARKGMSGRGAAGEEADELGVDPGGRDQPA